MILSEKEYSLIQHTDFFKLKESVSNKIMQTFSEIESRMKLLYPDLSEKVSIAPSSTASKISKGENLRHLPFLMLDFPKQFEASHIFSFRLLFWWGKGFTLFLHIKNTQLEKIVNQIIKNRNLIDEKTYISTDGDEWEHDFQSKNYQKLIELKAQKTYSFIKLAIPYGFEEVSILEDKIITDYQLLFKLLMKNEGN